MHRAVAVAAVLSLSSCNFAVKHPAVTAGLVGGTIALGSCELASSEQLTCLEIGGTAGVGLALIAAAALWLGYEDDTSQGTGSGGDVKAVDPTNLPPAPVFVPKQQPPPLVDAGIAIDAPVAGDAPID